MFGIFIYSLIYINVGCPYYKHTWRDTKVTLEQKHFTSIKLEGCSIQELGVVQLNWLLVLYYCTMEYGGENFGTLMVSPVPRNGTLLSGSGQIITESIIVMKILVQTRDDLTQK